MQCSRPSQWHRIKIHVVGEAIHAVIIWVKRDIRSQYFGQEAIAANSEVNTKPSLILDYRAYGRFMGRACDLVPYAVGSDAAV